MRGDKAIKRAYQSSYRLAALILFLLLITTSILGGFVSSISFDSKDIYGEGRQTANTVLHSLHLIKLKAAKFDPLVEEPRLAREISYPSENQYHIVQFTGPTQSHWIHEIQETGAEILGYIPDYSYIMRLEGNSKEEITKLPFFRWVGPYEPVYKIQEGLLEREGEIELNVLVFNDNWRNIQYVRNRLMGLGAVITHDGELNRVIRAIIDANKISDIASIPEVEWIDEYTPPVTQMDNIRKFTGANYVHLEGYNGTGIVGEVKDGGLQTSHPDFAGQIAGTDGTIVDDDHGTPCFGIVFSSGANDPKAKGMLYGGKGVMCYSWGVERIESIHNLVNNWGGLFQSNSWSMGEVDSTYSTFSLENDQAVAQYDIVMLYAAGNYGVTSYTCSQDSVAKNVIAVGALDHWNNDDRTDDMWVNGGWGGTPSQGPASDGRIKPDISGPFDWIYTTDSVDGDGQPGYSAGNYTNDFGGTSGATPVTAGAVGLVYEMYKRNHFGNNPDGNLPHASTVKAILIADAYQYDFAQATRYQQGWGGVDIRSVYDIGEDHYIVDEDKAVKTGESAVYAIETTGNGPLKISLVWTDVPGAPSAAQHLKNNLNLKVTDPDGISYWGNNGLISSKWSSSGGNADSKNNVENVFIQNPKNGTWTLEVIGQNIAEDAVPQTPAVYDQDFALVASNAVERLSIDITYPTSSDQLNGVVTILGAVTPDIVQVEVKIDNESWDFATITSGWSYNWDTTAFSDGEHIIYARGTNGTTYSETRMVEVILDNTAPLTDLIMSDPKYFDGVKWYSDNSTQFSFSAGDGGGSGVNYTRYKISYEGSTVQDWKDADIFTLSWGVGNYSIEYRSEDMLGNQEILRNRIVYVDSIPPETRLNISLPKYRGSTSDLFNVTTSTVFTIQLIEEQSIVATPWYIIDGYYRENWSFNLSGYNEGLHTISWGAEDYFGNNEIGNEISVILDREDPQTTLHVGGQSHRKYNFHSWNVTPTTPFTLIPEDGISGINFTWYFIDGEYFEGTSFTLEDGNHSDGPITIIYGSKDNVGHNESQNIELVYLDSTAPKTTPKLTGLSYRSSDEDSWNVTDDTLFELVAGDKHAGVNYSWYAVDGVYVEGTIFNLDGKKQGPHTITWGSIDYLEQSEEVQWMVVNLDNEHSVSDIKVGEPKYRIDDEDYWNVTKTTPFTLEFSDDYSGVGFVWYKINGIRYEFDDINFDKIVFNLSSKQEGYHRIEWGSTDNLEHEENSHSMRVYLSKSLPVTKMDIHGDKYLKSAGDLWYVTDKTNFVLKPEETVPGIKYTWYTIDGEYNEGTSFRLSGVNEGLHTITWGSMDNLDVNEGGNLIQVILDKLAPKTTVHISDPKYYEDSQARWAVNTKTIFTLEPEDKQSGVLLTWYMINDDYFEGTSFSLEGYTNGRHTITWSSDDNLGHNETPQSMIVLLDDSPPSTTLTIGEPKHLISDVMYINSSTTISLNIEDTGISISTIYYSTDGGSVYQVYKTPFTVSTMTRSIMYFGEDILGNREEESGIYFIVDNQDTDGDGIGDISDDDDDGDGLLDTQEDVNQNGEVDSGETDPQNPDTDGDGHLDLSDTYPLDKGKWEKEDNILSVLLIFIFIIIIVLFLLLPIIWDLEKGEKESYELTGEEGPIFRPGYRKSELRGEEEQFKAEDEQASWDGEPETEFESHKEELEGGFVPGEEPYGEDFEPAADEGEQIKEEETQFAPPMEGGPEEEEGEEAYFAPPEEGGPREDELQFEPGEEEMNVEEETEFTPEEEGETYFAPEEEPRFEPEGEEQAEFTPEEEEQTEFIQEEGEGQTEFMPEEEEQTEFIQEEEGEQAEFMPEEEETQFEPEEEGQAEFIQEEGVEQEEFTPGDEGETQFKPEEESAQGTGKEETEFTPDKGEAEKAKEKEAKPKRGKKKGRKGKKKSKRA
jgi:hypothetical protein